MRWVKITLISVIGCAVAAAALIKLDPPLAADIADNYLRPVIGTRAVIFLEDAFFNASDAANGLIYKFKQPDPPEFLDQGADEKASTGLDLSPLPVNSAFAPLSGEGVWHNMQSALFPGKEVLASSFVRPDPDRSFAIVSVVQIDPKSLGLGASAGIKEPGGKLGNSGTGMVPKDILDNGKLAAIFNGGFLYVDGKYGMIADGKTYVPLLKDAGTIAAYPDGTVKIFNYTGDNLGKDPLFARQNGPLIVENGQTTVNTANFLQFRGRVLHGGDFTWRSGIGINKKGNLIYVAGNNLSPTTLADALKLAGAVDAIQLDINPSQIYFFIFSRNAAGGYDTVALNKALEHFRHQTKYLDGSPRDFFYLYKRCPAG